MSERRDRIWSLVLALSLLAPLFVLAAVEPSRKPPEWDKLERYPVSDEAILEIYTLHAAHGTQLLGPYSRFDWNHPGPAFFYAALPLYRLLGRSTLGLNYTALVINLLALVAMMLSVRVWRRSWPCFWAFAWLLGLYLGYLHLYDPRFAFTNPWNPIVTILPFCSLVFLCASFVAGAASALPALVVCASFLVQTHIAYLPAVVAIVGISLLAYGSGFVRKLLCLRPREENHPSRWWLGVSLALFGVLWLPATVDLAYHPPGNLVQIARFFSEDRPLQSLRDVSFAVLSFASPLSLLTMVLLLPVAYTVGRRDRNDFGVLLSVLCVLGFCVALLSAMRIDGDLHSYLILWTSSFHLVAGVAMSVLLIPFVAEALPGPHRLLRSSAARIAGTALVVIVGIGNTSLVLEQGPDIHRRQDFNKANVLYRRLSRYLRANAVSKPLFDIEDDQKTWAIAAGILVQLYKNDVPFALDEHWLDMFGHQFAASGEEDAVIFLGNRDFREDGYRYRVITRHRGTVIYTREADPDGPSKDRTPSDG